MLKEPTFKSLPVSEDFNYDGEVDERWTREHYLGKDIEFVHERFRTLNSLSVLHDWYYVGMRAFRYYIFGAFRYLQDEESTDDSDVYSALAGLLIEKLEKHPDDLRSIANYIAAFCTWAVENYEKFGVAEHEDIYGDVKSRYIAAREIALKVSKGEL